MNILYTCDNNYVWIMGISMISLFENNKDTSINVFLLGDRITEENKNILTSIAQRYNEKFTLINVENFEISSKLCSQRWPKSAYLRLYAGQLLPSEIEKIIYLDCDTIVCGSLKKLWIDDCNWQFEFNGVKDCIGKRYKKNIGLNYDATYINAGVLLVNLNKLRNVDISQAITQFLSRYSKIINYADQDVLNGIFKGKVGSIPPNYNVMTSEVIEDYDKLKKIRKPSDYYSKGEFEVAVKHPTIIHYTTYMLIIRPWFLKSNHPFANEFDKYKFISPWREKKKTSITQNSSENKVINIVEKFPNKIKYSLLGILHANLKPNFVRLKAILK